MNLDIAIVTYNRLEKLKKTLQHYCDQTASFRNLIIVNNSSTDGTGDYLERWIEDFKQQGCKTFNPILITAKENLGGAGGFYLGQKKALELGADWVMVADDDAYAEPNMVEEFYKYVDKYDCSRISAICAEVLNTNGEIVCHHRDRWYIEKNKFFRRESSKIEDYKKETFFVDLFSYVGTFLNVQALREYGLVNSSFFIYSDDSEHSLRLKKFGLIQVVPALKIVHDDCAKADQMDDSIIVSWRDYYIIRNEFRMLLIHMPRIAFRYFYWHVRDWILHRQGRSPRDIVENSAKWDAFLGRMGKHKVYKPGWQIIKNENA